MQRMKLLEQYRHFADGAGERLSASDEEGAAADYIAATLSADGLDPQQQTFMSAASAYAPAALFAGVALLSVFLFWQPQPVGAAAATLLTATALVSLLLEMQYRSNPLRWMLPIEESRNVFVRIPPAATGDVNGSARKTIVISTHLDAQRHPAVFNVIGGRSAIPALLRAGQIAAAILLVLFVAGIVTPVIILRQIALLPGAVMLAIFILMLLAQRAPVVKGQGDNAGGLAVLLDTAAGLHSAPLAGHDALILFTGASEAGAYGMQAFLNAHRAELAGASHILLTAMGAAGTIPAVAGREIAYTGVAGDPALVSLAGGLAAAHPDLGATRIERLAAHGELNVSIRHGLHALSLTSAPGSASDDDEKALQRAGALVRVLLQSIDTVPAGTAEPMTTAA